MSDALYQEGLIEEYLETVKTHLTKWRVIHRRGEELPKIIAQGRNPRTRIAHMRRMLKEIESEIDTIKTLSENLTALGLNRLGDFEQ